MKYKRMPIEIEAPEQFGYENIACNLAESSVTDAIFKDLDLNINNLLLCYGHHVGKPELRNLIASESENLTEDDVLLTVGAAAALFIISTSLLTANDHLVVIRPNYATNIETPRAIGCKIDYLDLKFEENFALNIDNLASLIKPETKLVSLTCPHNPTGVMISENDLKRIIALIEEKNCLLLFDETYREMTFGKTLPVAASLSSKVISVSSLSKTYGLPGIRLGWLINRDKQLMETFLAAKEQIYICNSVVDEEIGFLFLNKKNDFLPKIKTHINNNFSIVKNWINSQNYLEWVIPSGGVVCFPRIKPEISLDPTVFYQILNEKYKTFVGPGHWFEMDKKFMRIGYGWPDKQELSNGLDNIINAVNESVNLI
jgi:aspartate/methionine/tyrosine aminotransferase